MVDLEIQWNKDCQWKFGSQIGSQPPKGGKPLEFEFIFAHELIKAMGFYSNFETWNLYPPMSKSVVANTMQSRLGNKHVKAAQRPAKYITTPVFSANEMGNAFINYPSPLDSISFIIPRKGWIPNCLFNCKKSDGSVQLLSVTEGFKTVYATVQPLKTLRGAKTLIDAGVKLFGTLSGGKSFAKLSDGTALQFSTLLGKLDNQQLPMTEYIIRDIPSSDMYPNLDDMMARCKTDTIFGPIALKYFGEIGYATRKNPRVSELVTRPELQKLMDEAKSFELLQMGVKKSLYSLYLGIR